MGLHAVATRFVFTGTSLWCLIATLLSSLPVYNFRQSQAVLWQFEGVEPIIWKALVGFRIVELAQKFNSNFVSWAWNHIPLRGIQWNIVCAKPLFLTQDSFSVLLSLLAWSDFFFKSTWIASCFLQNSTLPGCTWKCSKLQHVVSSCLSGTDLVLVGLSRVTCSVTSLFFFFLIDLRLKGAWLTLVKIRRAWFYHSMLASFHQS